MVSITYNYAMCQVGGYQLTFQNFKLLKVEWVGFEINNHFGSRVIGFKKLRRIVYACARLVGRCVAKR